MIYSSHDPWDPDKVAPPMRGGVYQRERPVLTKLQWAVRCAGMFLFLIVCGVAVAVLG